MIDRRNALGHGNCVLITKSRQRCKCKIISLQLMYGIVNSVLVIEIYMTFLVVFAIVFGVMRVRYPYSSFQSL